MRKITPIIIIVAFLALGVGVYFGWQKAKPYLNPTKTPSPTAEELLKEKINPISDKEVFGYWANTSTTTTEISYIALDGKIFKAGEQNEEISGQTINNLQSIKASSDGSKILIKSGSFSSSTFNIFDLSRKVWQPLDLGITAADWSPIEQKIIYLVNTKSGNSNLVIKDLATKAKQKTTTVMSLAQKDFDLSWIDKDNVLLLPQPSSQTKGEAWIINLKDKSAKLFSSGDGLMINWQKNKNQGIKLAANQQKLAMSLIDKNSQETTLNFYTLPDKCAIADSLLYCAIATSQSLPIGAINLPDDYLKKAVYFNDSIYKIDINGANEPEEIFATSADAPIDISRLTKVGNSLIFINRYDNKLYQFAL
ncbi:MAG: hypothetical protein WC297_02310 [Candidatus Paceibacterota bacterium]|jgi:hypothetical protein